LGLFSFGKKKPTETPADAGAPSAGAGSPSGGFVAQPEKARKFFDHAKTIAATGNYEYALMLYAKGFRFDPSSLDQHKAMYQIALLFNQAGGKPASRDNIKELDGPSPVDKFALAEYMWAREVLNADHLFRMLEATAKIGLFEFGAFIAPKTLEILRKQKKQNKALWLKGKTMLAGVEAWGEAHLCVEEAVKVDPSDTQLAADLKDLTARHALKQGGYNNADAGKTGGFRANVRDAGKQQQLADANAIVQSEETEARILERARKDFEENPMSPDAVQKLGSILRKQGTPESEEEAMSVLLTGFERTKEYRFKMAAGEIRVNQLRRKLQAANKAVDANPEDEALKAAQAQAKAELLDVEARELRERQKNYPTDRSIKAELGRIEFELGNFQEAMGAFQACKDEAKLRIFATHMLGRCFAAEGWHSEAASEYREALQGLGAGESDRELPIKYDLMVALMELARSEKNGSYAREAGEICSAIVRRDISYRDIRAKRKEIDGLMKELPA
jgi:tetratricopeptide (TPR) repeat protein